jgi:DNA-binding transcriptional LysR family regulator
LEEKDAVKNIELPADPSVGEVRAGCNPFLAATFVSAAVDRLSRRYPRVVFRLVTAYVETLYRELTERSVDLLVARRFHAIADERLHHELLFDDSYSVWWARKVRRPGRARSSWLSS